MDTLKSSLQDIFERPINVKDNYISYVISGKQVDHNQSQTEAIFSNKWIAAHQYDAIEKMYEFQCKWFLNLYGFETEVNLVKYLSDKYLILDTGCGLGYKSAWFATLAPHATVIGIDISDALDISAKNFNLPNLYFIKGDIADTGLINETIDFVVCDQVIMHTEIPEKTFRHLSRITKMGGEFACYVYSKKALPRELLDDHFRRATHNIPDEEMWQFSEQLTELGKRLSELKISFEAPDIPLLGIKGGNYDIQRFIYWNFLKCFWKEDWGFELSKATNYDWYAPSNAKRFSKEEFIKMVTDNHLEVIYFHEEDACYSGRFLKK